MKSACRNARQVPLAELLCTSEKYVSNIKSDALSVSTLPAFDGKLEKEIDM